MTAVLANSAPTGDDVFDFAYRAAFAWLVVIFGARAKPWILAAAGVVACIGSWTSPGLLAIAATVTGVSFAVLATIRRSPAAAAVGSAVLAAVLLRLEWPAEPHGATALLAAIAAVPVAISGIQRSQVDTRRRAIIALGVAGAFALLASLGALAAGVSSRDPLSRAADDASRALASARRGDEGATKQALVDAVAGFERADLAVHRPWSIPGRAIPVVAQHLRAASTAASAGRDLASITAQSAAAAELRGLEVVDGRIDLAAVEALEQPLAQSVDAIRVARSRLSVRRSDWLTASVEARLERELTRLDTAEREGGLALEAVKVMPALLGGDGPKRYFLAIQTPAEGRASGGFIGSYGELVADNGKVSLGAFGRTQDLNTRGTPATRTLEAPADYVKRYSRFDPSVTWQNVTMSPDVPTVAKVVSSLYPQSGGVPVDGVITVDPRAIAAFLQLTGPMTVAPWPEPLTAGNAERVLLFDQYVQLDDAARVRFLGDVAQAVTKRLTSGSLPRPPVILEALAPAVSGKHLAIATTDDRTLGPLRRLRLAGAMAKADSDFLAVVTQNAGGNKIDWFLHREVSYDARVDDAGNVRATVEVVLRNEAPASGLPSYVIGNAASPPVPEGSNKTYLSVYTPWALTAATLDGEPTLVESEDELGRRVYSTYVVIPPGGSRTVTLTLRGSARGEPYVLDVHRQPLVHDDVVKVAVALPDGRIDESFELERDKPVARRN